MNFPVSTKGFSKYDVMLEELRATNYTEQGIVENLRPLLPSKYQGMIENVTSELGPVPRDEQVTSKLDPAPRDDETVTLKWTRPPRDDDIVFLKLDPAPAG